jgi:hypothetical protein
MSSDELRAKLRREYEARFPAPRVEAIELGRVRDYLLAMDEPAEIGPGDIVPPLFLLTLGRTRRPQPAKGGAVKAGDAYEFLAPVHVGERITVGCRVADIEEKQGKMGLMFLITTEWSYRNESGATVARATTTSLRWGQ